MGCVLQAGLGQNPARQASLYGGMPPESAALTVNQVCGSGLRAVSLAAQAIQTGDADFMVAGGMESMTNAPYLLQQARAGYRMGNGSLVDAMIQRRPVGGVPGLPHGGRGGDDRREVRHHAARNRMRLRPSRTGGRPRPRKRAGSGTESCRWRFRRRRKARRRASSTRTKRSGRRRRSRSCRG